MPRKDPVSRRLIFGGIAIAFFSVVFMENDWRDYGFWGNFSRGAGILGTEFSARWGFAFGAACALFGLYRRGKEADEIVDDTQRFTFERLIRRNFVARHWRGNLSLGVSFWVNLIGLNFLLAVAMSLFLQSMKSITPMGYLIFFFPSFLVWLWGAVGVWRSAESQASHGERTIFGMLAKIFVVFQAIIWVLSSFSFQ